MHTPIPRARRQAGAVVLALSLAVGSAVALGGNPAQASKDSSGVETEKLQDKKKNNKKEDNAKNASKRLRQAVKPQAIREHMVALDQIATANGGTRASGTPGYAASKNYIVGKLRAAGYKPQVQTFDFAYFEEKSPATLSQVTPTPKTYVNPDDFTVMDYSGPGDVAGAIVAVDTDGTATDTSTSGCEAADFAGFTAGSVALIQRGSCDFAVKAQNALDAGASAAIIFNRGTTGNTATVAGTLGAPTTLPVLGASHATGLDLLDPAGTTVELTTDTESEIRPTFNVTAETRRGRSGNVVMAGGHLDSVNGSAGIVDNGSGSAALLEIAENLRKAKVKPRNKIRFAWWGAEESGLLGSTHYVEDLQANNPGALGDIALYLNFDMVASSNFVRFVFDGDNSTFGEDDGAAIGPAGSAAIERLYKRYFRSKKLTSDPTPFNGRTDYGPFIAAGVPAGGLFTGADGVKTPEQAQRYGGSAGVAYHPCYHEACDDLDSVNMSALRQMSKAIAHSVALFGYNTDRLKNDAAERRPSKLPGGAAKGAGLHPEHDHATR